jgi:hypothetical protein
MVPAGTVTVSATDLEALFFVPVLSEPVLPEMVDGAFVSVLAASVDGFDEHAINSTRTRIALMDSTARERITLLLDN